MTPLENIAFPALDALNVIGLSLSHLRSDSPTRFASSARVSLQDRKGRFVNQNVSDEIRVEYDVSDAVQGKHHLAYKEGMNVVLLEPDIARVFRDSASVNRALRLLMEVARDQTSKSAQQ